MPKRRRRTEQRFEYRVQRILQDAGFLVINVRKVRRTVQPFDLIAIRDGHAYPIEIKSRFTQYPQEQRNMQTNFAEYCSTNFYLLKQRKQRSPIDRTFLMELTMYNVKTHQFEAPPIPKVNVFHYEMKTCFLHTTFAKWLE